MPHSIVVQPAALLVPAPELQQVGDRVAPVAGSLLAVGRDGAAQLAPLASAAALAAFVAAWQPAAAALAAMADGLAWALRSAADDYARLDTDLVRLSAAATGAPTSSATG